jgi:hypothetical protein
MDARAQRKPPESQCQTCCLATGKRDKGNMLGKDVQGPLPPDEGEKTAFFSPLTVAGHPRVEGDRSKGSRVIPAHMLSLDSRSYTVVYNDILVAERNGPPIVYNNLFALLKIPPLRNSSHHAHNFSFSSSAASRTSWLCNIRAQGADPRWHASGSFIFVRTRGDIGNLVQALRRR